MRHLSDQWGVGDPDDEGCEDSTESAEPDDELEELDDELEELGRLDGGLVAAVSVSCPYCGAEVELVIDPVGGDVQEYVEDCEVCCQPWAVRVSMGRDGVESVYVGTLDES